MERMLICSDCDGTLLSDSKKIPELNMKVIMELKERGHIFAVATGRILQSARYYSTHFGKDTPVIASNGGVYDTGDGILHKAHLEKDSLLKVYRLAEKHGLVLNFFTHDTVYCNDFRGAFFTTVAFNRNTPRQFAVRTVLLRDEQSLLTHSSSIINAIIIARKNPEILKEIRAELMDDPTITVESSRYDNLEIIPDHISKGTAVQALAEHFGIAQKNVICFGDGENDISMLKYAGKGFAMDNAHDSIKKEADGIALSNEAAGIGHKLSELFNLAVTV